MKTVFLTGHTDMITTKLLEQISRRFSVVLTSPDEGREEDEGRLYHLKPGTTAYEQLFWAYDFNAVWYFSPYCDAVGDPEDMSDLQKVYDHCKENAVKKLIVISSSLLNAEQSRREEDILFADDGADVQVVVLRIPGIVTDENRNNCLGRLFYGLSHHTRTVAFPNVQEGRYEFLSMKELILLMEKITLSARESGVFQLPGEYMITKDRLIAKASSIRKNCRIVFKGKPVSYNEKGDISRLTEKYGYVVRDRKQLDFESLYETFAEEEKYRSPRFGLLFGRLRSKISNRVAKVIDVIVLFFVAEYLSRFISGIVYFREIDVRLIYIFLIATFHGLKPGVIAALAECVVLFFEYRSLGISGLQLFYNVENWIPFVLCIITGAVTGYYSDLKENEKKLVDRENGLLREKYLFLNDMYNVSSEARDEYRRQILTFDNSYGKIYDAIGQMNRDSVSQVCEEAVSVLGNLLDNPSAVIYLQSAAGGPARKICSFSSEEYGSPMLGPETSSEMFMVLDDGKVWKNVQLLAGTPMYAIKHIPTIGGHREVQTDQLILVLWDALPEQMNDYYANQFEILCRLAGDAADRAALLEYNAGHTEPNTSVNAKQARV